MMSSLYFHPSEKGRLTFIKTRSTRFQFSSAQWTPANVQTAEASLKGVNKKMI